MRYVVTGGAGAIGSNLVNFLLSETQTDAVVVIDDLSSGFEWLLPKQSTRLLLVRQSVVGNRVFASSLDFAGVDRVFHLAAHFANQNSVDHPLADLLGNGVGTLNVLQASVRAGVQQAMFASAGCAAGHEDTPYQIHKSLGEAYCRYFQPSLPVTICRFHNSYGPGEVPGKYRNVIPNWIWAAMHGEPLTVYNCGNDARDFIFVDDVVNNIVRLAPSLNPHEIGTGRLTRTGVLARMIVDITRSKSEIVYVDTKRRWDHPGRAAVECLTPAGEFKPLEHGIEDTVAWFESDYDAIKRSIR